MIAVTVTDLNICTIELKLRVASYKNRRLTLWLVPAKFNSLCFINNPRRFLDDVVTVPGQFNRSVNLVFDEN